MATIAQMLVRVTFLVQIVLGVAFWTGHLLNLVTLHILSGILLVLGLWALAALGARARAPMPLVAVAAIWGALMIAFGLTQDMILAGSLHWIIQVLHLLVGLAAVGQAEGLGVRIKRAQGLVAA